MKSAQPHHFISFSFLLFSDTYALFCAFLQSAKNQLFSFHALPRSLPKTPGARVGATAQASVHRLFPYLLTPLRHDLDAAKLGEVNRLGVTYV